MYNSNLATPAKFLARAKDLIDRGFSVIPIAPREKKPAGPGANSRTRDLDLVKAWADVWPDANVAVCSDDDITILESDDAPRFREILKGMGVTLPETLTGGARENRPHWFFKRTPECGDECLEVPGLFEFRNKNQYVVGPGSIHPEGHEYRFWKSVPIVELPAAVIKALRELDAAYQGDEDTAAGEHIQPGAFAVLKKAYMRHLDPSDLLKIEDLEIGEGERHYTLLSLAGLLHDGKRSAEEIAEILRGVRDEYFSDGKGDQEIENAAEWAVRQTPVDLEPWDLPSFSYGLRVFASQADLDKWISDHVDDFSESWAIFAAEDVPAQRVLVTLDGEPLIREQTVTEILAYRGIGKSAVVASLIKIMTAGGEFCGFKAQGGQRVLLVDGELPRPLLQKRLTTFAGDSATKELLRVRSLAKVGNRMPALADLKVQADFLHHVTKGWRPDVIVFDTRTAVFKHDTNNAEQLLAVNEFLIGLRAEGFAVIIAHHAGKNNTQRGRTDNDDITDLIMQLNKRPGWQPGMGLEFKLAFEKVRYGDRLDGFDAKWSAAGGWQRLDNTSEVIQALLQGGSIAEVAEEFGLSKARIQRIRATAASNGIVFPESKAGRKAKAADKGGKLTRGGDYLRLPPEPIPPRFKRGFGRGDRKG